MARLLVKFTQGYSRYNKDDTAAFEPDVAKKLCEGKGKVAVMVGNAAKLDEGHAVIIGKVDTREVQQIVDQARADLQARSRELDDREKSLDQKAQDLADREEALEARGAAIATGEPGEDPAPTEQDKTTTKPKGSGEPPNQGAKK